MNRLTALSVSIQKRYDGLSRTARTFLAIWLVVQVALLGLLWYITPKRIFEGERILDRHRKAQRLTSLIPIPFLFFLYSSPRKLGRRTSR